ncbi:hypothetical protein BKA64DRAFT_658683 [Cadophora sp. MPI-SDFR-AT-0126]|nr:hypothetical protein BKA64DRAFT_658683 [Leotiomycetes sp. MPI-SDFR-AT-0126]
MSLQTNHNRLSPPNFSQQWATDHTAHALPYPTFRPPNASSSTLVDAQYMAITPPGGVLIKDANILDMLFLSLSRTSTAQRSPSAEEEDRFYKLLRRVGAKWWLSRDYQIDVEIGTREVTKEETKVLVLG